MRILITGNMGYVGPAVVRHLRETVHGAHLIGYDTGYFAHCLTSASRLPEVDLDCQYFGDVRGIHDELLESVDGIVHLAAISNDPMGNQFEDVTYEINHRASVDLARRSIALGVKRFVFASSCSMYGFAEGGPRKESDALNPLTAYSKSKVATEKDLSELENGNTTITSLRFSTACGMSDRLRLDLVLNDFVACAVASKEITVLSDGTPWRPLIDIKDMARAIHWALTRETDNGGPFVAVNVGTDQWNYQVRDLAQAVANAVPGTTVHVNENAPPDRRSYRVDFSLYRALAPDHQPQVSLAQAIDELKTGMEAMGFDDPNFRSSQFMRLKVLEKHLAVGKLDHRLSWR